jgi:hypothetical protein
MATLHTRSGNAARREMMFKQWLTQGKRCAHCVNGQPLEFADARFETPNHFVEGEVNLVGCRSHQWKKMSGQRQQEKVDALATECTSPQENSPREYA